MAHKWWIWIFYGRLIMGLKFYVTWTYCSLSSEILSVLRDAKLFINVSSLFAPCCSCKYYCDRFLRIEQSSLSNQNMLQTSQFPFEITVCRIQYILNGCHPTSYQVKQHVRISPIISGFHCQFTSNWSFHSKEVIKRNSILKVRQNDWSEHKWLDEFLGRVSKWFWKLERRCEWSLFLQQYQ